MASKIKVTAQKRVRGDRETWSIVEVDGVNVGYIRKFCNTRSMTCPWQAFGWPANQTTPARVLGEFYEKDGKQRAIDAVVANASSLAS
jgi:hypothetical protein